MRKVPDLNEEPAVGGAGAAGGQKTVMHIDNTPPTSCRQEVKRPLENGTRRPSLHPRLPSTLCGRFATVPRSVVLSPQTRPAAKVVLAALIVFGAHREPRAVSLTQLRKATGLGKDAVRAALTQLEKRGLLTITRRRKTTAVFLVRLDKTGKAWVGIRADWLAEPGVSAVAKTILMALLAYRPKGGRWAWPSLRKLSQVLGLDPRTVRRGLQELRTWTWVRSRLVPELGWTVYEFDEGVLHENEGVAAPSKPFLKRETKESGRIFAPPGLGERGTEETMGCEGSLAQSTTCEATWDNADLMSTKPQSGRFFASGVGGFLHPAVRGGKPDKIRGLRQPKPAELEVLKELNIEGSSRLNIPMVEPPSCYTSTPDQLQWSRVEEKDHPPDSATELVRRLRTLRERLLCGPWLPCEEV
ncbi:MAG: helix-turn-helix domain-containing protein [Thermofilaceae archaeon]